MGHPVLDAALNADVERVASDGRARAYVRRAYEPSGALERPLVSLHTTLDPAAQSATAGMHRQPLQRACS